MVWTGTKEERISSADEGERVNLKQAVDLERIKVAMKIPLQITTH